MSAHGKKIVRVPYTVALEILSPVHLGPPLMDPPLPGGTAILAVHENYRARSLDFTLQNSDWAATDPGLEIPLHETSWVRPGSLVMLRNDGRQPTDPGRVVVIQRSTLRELGAILTTGLSGGPCLFQPAGRDVGMTAAELAELARHVDQHNRLGAELLAAKKRAEIQKPEGAP